MVRLDTCDDGFSEALPCIVSNQATNVTCYTISDKLLGISIVVVRQPAS